MSADQNQQAGAERRVPDYDDPPQTAERYTQVTTEYVMPFNYENIAVNRKYMTGTEFHGVELNPVNSVTDGMKTAAGDSIVVTETDPIVRVTVIGSACTPPGYVMIECDPVESYYRADEMRTVMPVRFRIGNLWGSHPRCDQWWCWGVAETLEGEAHDGSLSPNQGGRAAYEQLPPELLEKQRAWAPLGTVKSHYREHPNAGMSCAIFEIPKSKSVRITGGGEPMAWSTDNYPDDTHYSFRIIRTTVAVRA